VNSSPYLIIHILHHVRFCLLNCGLQPLSLAITGVDGWGMADGTVWVHPNDGLSVFLPGIHLSGGEPKATEAGTAGM